jgi:hypothetical protein
VKSARLIFVAVIAFASFGRGQSVEQGAKPAQSAAQTPAPANSSRDYSGMYAFRKEGEFIQITVEDDGLVTGFISRYSDAATDKGAFLDQFFKSAKLDGNKLTFTTKIVGATAFDFKGSFDRGDGKNSGDEAYYILKGTLTENRTDANKKVSSKSEEVAWKSFPKS